VGLLLLSFLICLLILFFLDKIKFADVLIIFSLIVIFLLFWRALIALIILMLIFILIIHIFSYISEKLKNSSEGTKENLSFAMTGIFLIPMIPLIVPLMIFDYLKKHFNHVLLCLLVCIFIKVLFGMDSNDYRPADKNYSTGYVNTDLKQYEMAKIKEEEKKKLDAELKQYEMAKTEEEEKEKLKRKFQLEEKIRLEALRRKEEIKEELSQISIEEAERKKRSQKIFDSWARCENC